MSVFESTIKVNKPVETVYAFLADMNNHRQLMPDNITNWESTTDMASFNIENITKLSIRISERINNREIVIIPAEKPPFDMELKWILTSTENQTQATFMITADLSMLMKMLASGPLKKLADDETQNLADLLR